MCLAVFPTSHDGSKTDDSIKIQFVFERIYLRRNGSSIIDLDLLILNQHNADISTLRLVIPHALFDNRRLSSIHNSERAAQKQISKLRHEQLSRIEILTDQMSVNADATHWAYDLVPDLENRSARAPDGTFVVHRTDADGQQQPIAGFVKNGWKLQAPESLDDWVWLVFAISEVAVVDLTVDAARRPGEALKPRESMWIRLRLTVPATRFNRKGRFERLVARSSVYRQVFLSPGRVVRQVTRLIEKFSAESRHAALHKELRYKTGNAKNAALALVARSLSVSDRVTPAEPLGAAIEVAEWRTMLFGEYGADFDESVSAPDNTETAGGVKRQTTTMVLPPHADPRGCRRFPLPLFMHWFRSKRTRDAIVVFVAFGTTYARRTDDQARRNAYPDNYALEISTRSNNPLYLYFSWLGAIGFILSLISLYQSLF